MIATLEAIYAAGGTLTGLLLIKYFGPRFVRWIASNPPRSVEDWVFVPVLIPIGVTLCIFGLTMGSFLWPMTAIVAWRSRQERISLEAAAEIEEDRLLLEDVRRAVEADHA